MFFFYNMAKCNLLINLQFLDWYYMYMVKPFKRPYIYFYILVEIY